MIVNQKAIRMVATGFGVTKDDKLCNCAICGRGSPFGDAGHYKKVLSNGFTDWLLLSRFEQVCRGCAKVISGSPNKKNMPLRSKNVIVLPPSYEGGPLRFSNPKFSELLNFLMSTNKPNGYVVSFANSGKKHHYFHAGLSSKTVIRLGTDDGCVVVKDNDDLRSLVNAIQLLITVKESEQKRKHNKSLKDAVLSGHYHAQYIAEFDIERFDRLESIVSRYRGGRLLPILVRIIHTPVPKQDKTTIE